MDVLGDLYGMRAKKIADSTLTAKVAQGVAPTESTNPTIVNISQVIEDVKDVFVDTFSKDVYAHFNMVQQIITAIQTD
ncbi:MAG: hypothetical protein IKS39_10980 [Clostridia bacterium]|nr:hypothetical protein [Clostridia bacterium]